MTDDTADADGTDGEADLQLDSRLRANEDFAEGLRLGIAAELGQTGFNDDGSERNHYEVFGWPRSDLDGWDEDNWLALYLRNAYARIVIEKPAFSTWRDAPQIRDVGRDPDADPTPFERGVGKLASNYSAWSYCERADRAAGIGQHGLLLVAFRDVADGDRSAWRTDATDQGFEGLSALAGLKPILGAQIEDIDYGDMDDGDRWGKPIEYTIDLSEEIDSETEDDEDGTIQVHHSRVVDIPATRPLDDETLARPRVEPVLNNILDIEKILGAAAEAGYRAADYGLHLNADPTKVDLSGGMDDLEDELQRYEHGLQRYLRTSGIDVERLGGDIQDPSGIVENNLDAIAGQTGIPKKEFRGNESGEVSGAEADERSYFGMIAERREQYATPYIVRPLLDRLQAVGILPAPAAGEYRVEWPDLVRLSAQDRAEVESKRAQVIQAVPGLAGDTAMRYLKDGADALPELDEGGDPLAANLDVDESDAAVQETFESTVGISNSSDSDDIGGSDAATAAAATGNAAPALDDPVELPERIQNAGEAALKADEKGWIPDDCGTGVGSTRAEQGADNDVVVGDLLTRRNDRTPIPAYLNSHEDDLSAEGPPTEWGEEEWSDCGNAGIGRWLYYADWFKRKANELATARDEEPPYDDVSANATRYAEGDEVSTPQGVGVVADVLTSTVKTDETTVEASADSPTYVVVVEDGRVGYETYKAADIHSTTIETDVDDPEAAMADEEETANALRKVLNALAPTSNADFSPPPSWRNSSTPNRIIALKAFSSMGGSFDGCVRNMRGEVSTPEDFCGSFLDYTIGNPYWRGDSILPGD
jgi:hypothetical protein